MSVGWVIDSSVGLAWVHQDQSTPETDKVLVEIEAGASVFVPGLWFLEIANGLLVLQRRKKFTAVERKAALETLGRLNFQLDEEAGRTAFHQVSDLAAAHVYDAVYLELALRRKLPLASRDEALCKVAKGCRVKLLL